MEGLVKSHSKVCQELKGLRFLPYLQARQPQLHERAEHLRLLELETVDFVTHSSKRVMSFMFTLAPHYPQV